MLEFHTPASGDWLVIKDSENNKTIYEGHGSGDEMWEVLCYLGIEFNCEELPDDEFERKYC